MSLGWTRIAATARGERETVFASLQRDPFVEAHRLARSVRTELRAFQVTVLDGEQTYRLRDDELARFGQATRLQKRVADLRFDHEAVGPFAGVGVRRLLDGEFTISGRKRGLQCLQFGVAGCGFRLEGAIFLGIDAVVFR